MLPWPLGYPESVAFICNDKNFLTARSYGISRPRVLPYCQDELSVLKKDLIALDYDDVTTNFLAFVLKELDERTDRDSVHSLKISIRKMKSYQCRFLDETLAPRCTHVLNEMPVLIVPCLERKRTISYFWASSCHSLEIHVSSILLAADIGSSLCYKPLRIFWGKNGKMVLPTTRFSSRQEHTVRLHHLSQFTNTKTRLVSAALSLHGYSVAC